MQVMTGPPSRRLMVGALGTMLVVTVACRGTGQSDRTSASVASGSVTAPGGASSAGPSAGAVTSARVAAFNAVLRRAVDRSNLAPGVTAAVVSDRGVWQGAYGVSGRSEPLVPTSVMCLASISKTFTAAEVLHLAAEGKVDLDRPMSRYVSDRLTSNGATVRQALGMISGLLDDDIPGLSALLAAHPNQHLGVQRPLDLMPDDQISAPGKTWHYSNANYLLLARLIEQVTRRALPDALRIDLFEPAGLTHLAVQDAEQPPAPLAYPFDAKGPVEDGYLPTRAAASVLAGAGSIAADALSVARWGFRLYGGQVLPPALTRAMTTPQSADTGNSGLRGYGLGTMIFPEAAGHRALGHTGGLTLPGPHGSDDGYTTIMLSVPDLRVSIAVLTPSTDVDLGSIVDGLLAAALD